MLTRSSALPPKLLDATAATFPGGCGPVPAHCEAKLEKASPISYVDPFPSSGLSHLKVDTAPVSFSGLCQSSIWLQAARGGGSFSLAKASYRPAYFLPPGCAGSGLRYACAAGASRDAGGSSVCRCSCFSPAVCAPLGLRCRRWRREGREGTGGACECAREGRRGASSSLRAGRAARVSSSRRGPGRRHVGGRPMPGWSRRRPRERLLPCGGLPWRGVHVPVAGGAGEGVR